MKSELENTKSNDAALNGNRNSAASRGRTRLNLKLSSFRPMYFRQILIERLWMSTPT